MQGRIQGGPVRGAPPPWIFIILRKRALSLTKAIEKETKRKKVKEKEEIYRFWSYDGQRTFLLSIIQANEEWGIKVFCLSSF